MTRKKSAALALSVALAAALAAAAYWAYRRAQPASLASWCHLVARPGFKLRYRTQTKSHFVAVFQFGDDRLAFCRRRIDGGGPDPQVKIIDVWGNSLVDADRPREPLARVFSLGFVDYVIDDGELVPIRSDFRGTARVVFDIDDEPGERETDQADPYRLGVLDVPIEWGERQAARAGNDE